MSKFFPQPKYSRGRVIFELDLSNYATKTDLKMTSNLAILKSDVDKLHIDKSKNVPTNLNNLKSKVSKLDIRKFRNCSS